jgi:hypothetical protein
LVTALSSSTTGKPRLHPVVRPRAVSCSAALRRTSPIVVRLSPEPDGSRGEHWTRAATRIAYTDVSVWVVPVPNSSPAMGGYAAFGTSLGFGRALLAAQSYAHGQDGIR